MSSYPEIPLPWTGRMVRDMEEFWYAKNSKRGIRLLLQGEGQYAKPFPATAFAAVADQIDVMSPKVGERLTVKVRISSKEHKGKFYADHSVTEAYMPDRGVASQPQQPPQQTYAAPANVPGMQMPPAAPPPVALPEDTPF